MSEGKSSDGEPQSASGESRWAVSRRRQVQAQGESGDSDAPSGQASAVHGAHGGRASSRGSAAREPALPGTRGGRTNLGREISNRSAATSMRGANSVVIVRVTFSLGSGSVPSTECGSDRLLVRQEIAFAERDKLHGELTDIERFYRSHTCAIRDRDERSRIGESAVDYLSERIGDPAFSAFTREWHTRDSLPPADIAAALSGSETWLRGLVEGPLRGIGLRARISDPGAEIGAGIGARFVTGPLTEPIHRIERLCEVVGLGIGLAAGIHPLMMACAKRLVHDEFNRTLSRAIYEIYRREDSGNGRTALRGSSPGRQILDRTGREGRSRGRREDPEKDRQEPWFGYGREDRTRTGRGDRSRGRREDPEKDRQEPWFGYGREDRTRTGRGDRSRGRREDPERDGRDTGRDGRF